MRQLKSKSLQIYLSLGFIFHFLVACSPERIVATVSSSFWGESGSGRNITLASSPMAPLQSPKAPDGEFASEVTRVSYSLDHSTIEWMSFDTEAMPGVSFLDIQQDADAFIAARSAFLGITLEDLQTNNIGPSPINDRLLSVSYSRVVGSIRVEGAYVEIVYSRDDMGRYRIYEVINRSLPSARLSNEIVAAPTSDKLREIVAETVGFADFQISSSTKVLLPIASALDTPGTELKLRRVLRVKIRQDSTGDSYRLCIALGTFEILESTRDVFGANLSAKVLEKNYIDAKTIDSPLSYATYTIGGVQKTLDGEGGFGADRLTGAVISLTSPMVQTFVTGTNTPLTVTTNLTDANTTITGPTANQSRGLNAFTAIHRVRRFALQFLKANEASVLTTGARLRINDGTGACNAYFDPTAFQLVFFSQGTSGNTTCANTADINDVIFHEWGHSLDNAVGKVPGIADGAFSEGIGDIIATYMTAAPKMGIGFFLNDAVNFVRTVENVRTYPPLNAAEREVHSQGEIIGGTFWDLRKAMIERYGLTKGSYQAGWLFFRHLLTTDAYVDSYQAILRLDDNDGNAATKSPNYCLINKAFAKHGLATDENCQDNFASKVAIACDLVLGVQSESQGQATLLVSAPAAAGIKLCAGERGDCLESSKYLVETAAEGTAGSKIIYQAKTQMALAELTPITVGRFDVNGKLVSARTFRISGK